MSDKPWKRDERKVCRDFGCERHGPMQSLGDDDGTHPNIHIQVKRRKQHSIIKVWDEAKEFTSQTGKVPIVALTQHNRPGYWILVKNNDLLSVARQYKLAKREGAE